MGRKPLSAIDGFESRGNFHRSLSFMGENGLFESKSFADDSMVIIASHTEVYDWYGRLVELGEDIESVISTYGSEIEDTTPQRVNQSLIVKKTNGKYAIAILKLEDDPEFDGKTRFPLYKRILIGGYIGKKSIIECTDWEFSGIDEELKKTPVMQAFINNRPDYVADEKLDIFYGVQAACSKMPEEISVIRTPHNRGYDAWISHCFVKNRETILSAKPGEKLPIDHATHVVGKITVSPDGRKMFARAPFKNLRGFTTIATDVDVLNHMKNAGIYWYYM